MKLLFPSNHSTDPAKELLEWRKAPADRPLMAVCATKPTDLSWENLPEDKSNLALVLTPALEMPGPWEKTLRITVKETGKLAAESFIWCADPYQIITIELDKMALPASGVCTLRLELTPQSGHLWVFGPANNTGNGLEFHTPHIVSLQQSSTPFTERLLSMASLQMFSWKEGCVLDGLYSLHSTGRYPKALQVIKEHLRFFGFDEGDLVYETPESLRVNNRLTSIETTLPFATIAQIAPNHPWLGIAQDFWMQQIAEYGQVQEGDMISSEGAYTVAYPMTVIGSLLGDEQWIKIAEKLLRETFQRLVLPDAFYLRHFRDNSRTHRNWARGLGWLLLGHAQTLRYHPNHPADIVAQMHKLADLAAYCQNPKGLWNCYVDAPETDFDSAGSAAIAAGMIVGANHNLLPQEFAQRARQTHTSLLEKITKEGFLDGCSQSNKGGEKLQRSNYRVVTPYTLGLLGTLESGIL